MDIRDAIKVIGEKNEARKALEPKWRALWFPAGHQGGGWVVPEFPADGPVTFAPYPHAIAVEDDLCAPTLSRRLSDACQFPRLSDADYPRLHDALFMIVDGPDDLLHTWEWPVDAVLLILEAEQIAATYDWDPLVAGRATVTDADKADAVAYEAERLEEYEADEEAEAQWYAENVGFLGDEV